MSNEQGRIDMSRLDNLEQRLDEFPASIDTMLRRQKDELISEFRRLMQEQMDAIMSKLANSEVLDFSVERTSSSHAAAKVFEEMPAAKVQSVHSNVRQASAVTVHETRSNFHERQETVGGFGERLDNLGGRRLSIELIKGSQHDKVESSSTKKPEVTTEDQNSPSDMDVGISVNKTGGKGSPFLSKIGLVLGIGNSCSDYICFVGKGKSGSEVLAKFSPYNCLVVERGMAKVRLKYLIRQPEQPLPPPEPPPSYSASKLPPSRVTIMKLLDIVLPVVKVKVKKIDGCDWRGNSCKCDCCFTYFSLCFCFNKR